MASAPAPLIYLDNNGTTIPHKKVVELVKDWTSAYNPSSDSKWAKVSGAMIEKVRLAIHKHCNTSPQTHTVLFTSGASESNSTIIRDCAYSFRRMTQTRGHIISSAIEHHSVLKCLEDLKDEGAISYSLIAPNIYGTINVSDVEKEIDSIRAKGLPIALITIMFANNELGSINNIKGIGELAFKNKIPFHTDAVQVFGKFTIDLPASKISAISVSFHKFYGPKGIGLLIISNLLIEGYGLRGIIAGSQQHGLRGGTENVAGIAGAGEALKIAFQHRGQKNEKLRQLKMAMIDNFAKHYPMGKYESYIDEAKDLKMTEIVILGSDPADEIRSLPNTLLVSIAKNKGNAFCNIKFKELLRKNGIDISIGSACHTDSPKASHVLTAIHAPPVIKKGVIRISLGDYNTMEEVKQFNKIFLEVLDQFIIDLDKNIKDPKKKTSIRDIGLST